MNELDKKLAEWAGLEWKWNHNPECPCGAVDDNDSMRSWHTKDGTLATRFYHEDINLTKDLTACFKWLVPKLLEQDINVSFFMDRGEPAGVFLTPLDIHKRIIVDAEIPALALCLAIEKLINDEQNKP